MSAVKAHYDNLLAPHYSWIFGGFEPKLEENRRFFRDHGIRATASGLALDLGAGCGFQSIPLAEAGYMVLAVDISRYLLADLKKNAGGLKIVTIEDDLLNFSRHLPNPPEIIVCMGDTLTHLDSLVKVASLFQNAFRALAQGGLLVLTFRDLVFELKGLERFIPVRSDSHLIFTCFLEYEKTHVKVHDVIYELVNDQWQMRKGVYRKLRIPPEWTKVCLQDLGFELGTFDIRNGMVTILARRKKLAGRI